MEHFVQSVALQSLNIAYRLLTETARQAVVTTVIQRHAAADLRNLAQIAGKCKTKCGVNLTLLHRFVSYRKAKELL